MGIKKDSTSMLRAHEDAMRAQASLARVAGEFEKTLAAALDDGVEIAGTQININGEGLISITAACRVFSSRRKFTRENGTWAAQYQFFEIEEAPDGVKKCTPVTTISVDKDGAVDLRSIAGSWSVFASSGFHGVHRVDLLHAVVQEVVGTAFGIEP